ncbi:hypothetical protein FQT94_22140 [Escherichia coli]|nr:hypothetical protein FQT78_22015 [Escherichia coli]QGJ62926.1 hypothetical protein FQT94_22140 [Escherichia coli]
MGSRVTSRLTLEDPVPKNKQVASPFQGRGLLDGINIGMLLEIVESQKQFFKNNLSDPLVTAASVLEFALLLFVSHSPSPSYWLLPPYRLHPLRHRKRV